MYNVAENFNNFSCSPRVPYYNTTSKERKKEEKKNMNICDNNKISIECIVWGYYYSSQHCNIFYEREFEMEKEKYLKMLVTIAAKLNRWCWHDFYNSLFRLKQYYRGKKNSDFMNLSLQICKQIDWMTFKDVQCMSWIVVL